MCQGLGLGQGMNGHLECFVCVQIQRKPAVWEEEVQAPEVEKIVSADFLGEGLQSSRIQDWVQQNNLYVEMHPQACWSVHRTMLALLGSTLMGQQWGIHIPQAGSKLLMKRVVPLLMALFRAGQHFPPHLVTSLTGGSFADSSDWNAVHKRHDGSFWSCKAHWFRALPHQSSLQRQPQTRIPVA